VIYDPKISEPIKATVIETFHVQRMDPSVPDRWFPWLTNCESREAALAARDDARVANPQYKFRATTNISTVFALEI
jgi:hypothetical protein